MPRWVQTLEVAQQDHAEMNFGRNPGLATSLVVRRTEVLDEQIEVPLGKDLAKLAVEGMSGHTNQSSRDHE